MKTTTMSFNSNPNVGLFVYATDNYALIGRDVPDNDFKKLEEYLQVPCIRFSIAGTGLCGVFLNGNNQKLLVPSIIFKKELEILEENKIEYAIIETTNTCLGNNMIVNDNFAAIGKVFEAGIEKQVEDALSVDVKRVFFEEFEAIGSVVKVHNNKALAFADISDKEADVLENLGLELNTGTANMGGMFVSSGIIVNKNALIIGDQSGGPEMVNIEESFRD